MSFSFVQITDLHVGITSTVSLAEDLRKIEAQVGGEVDFIAVTGDITDLGTEEQYHNYLEGVRATSLKTYPVPGNHDYGFGGGGGSTVYEKLVAPLNYSFDHGGVHFVAYDSIPPGSDERPTPWLLEDLAKMPKGTPVIILVHYPLEDVFYRQLDAYPIIATISGHWHATRTYKDGKITHFNSPPLSFGGIDFSPRGYRVFTWDGERLAVRTIPLTQPATNPSGGATDLELLWSAPLGGMVMLCAPVVREGRVYVSLMNDDQEPHVGGVGCWDAASGELVWRTELGASVKNSPFHSGDGVFVVTVTGRMVALDAATGTIRWEHQLQNPSGRWIFSSVTGKNGRVYGGHGSCFTSRDMATGECVFERDDLTSNDWLSSYCSPVVNDDRIFIGFFAQRLFCLDATTGQTVWKLDHSNVQSKPAFDAHGCLYLAWPGQIKKLNASTGELIWESPVAAVWCPVNPLYHDHTIYTGGGRGQLLALDATDGRQKWQWEGGSPLNDMLPYERNNPAVLSSPQLMGNEIVIGSNDGRLVGLDRVAGALVWSHQFEMAVSTTPAIAGDTIYLPLSDGRLRALRRR